MTPWRRVLAAACAALLTAFCLPATRAAHRAHLSVDLLSHESRHTIDRTRVIVATDAAEASTIARRHNLQLLGVLKDGSAVVYASSNELTELAADADVRGLSGDLPVRPSMSVSIGATAADQVRAGSPGLLGIGAIPGVNGQ